MAAHPRPRPRRAYLHGVLIGLGVWAILALLFTAGGFRTFDLKLLDMRLRLRGEQPGNDRIALVEIDDATIAAYGRWPIPRDTYALLLTVVEEAGAHAIGFDLLFLGEDSTDPRFDPLLAQVTGSYDNVVHAVGFTTGEPTSLGASITSEAGEMLRRHAGQAEAVKAPTAMSVALPYPELLSATSGLGHVMVAVDPDGVVRRVPLFVNYEGRLYPSLVMRLATMQTAGGAPRVRPDPRGFAVENPANGVVWRIPVDDEGATAIDFVGDRDSFPRAYSALDVLRWYRGGQQDRLREAFAGRFVLIGNTAVGEVATDVDATPFNTVTPLLFVHANALNALLEGRFLQRPSAGAYLGGLAAVGAGLGTLFVGLSLPLAAAVVAVLLLAFAIGQQLLLAAVRIDIPPMTVLLLPPLVYAAMASYRFIFLERFERTREKELQVAREIQRRLLPDQPPAVEAFDVFGTNVPALEVGGDYYDWLLMNNRTLALAVGDVSGKGISASLLMSHVRASFHSELCSERSPAQMIRAMHESLYRATEPGRFATFFLAQLDLDSESLRYCNAGHNPGLLVHGRAVTLLEGNGPPLGLLDPVEFTESEIRFEPGDTLVLYSDGITESPHRHDEYGDDRLAELTARLATGTRNAAEIGEAILADVRSFSGKELGADDITLVVVRRRKKTSCA